MKTDQVLVFIFVSRISLLQQRSFTGLKKVVATGIAVLRPIFPTWESFCKPQISLPPRSLNISIISPEHTVMEQFYITLKVSGF